MSHMNMMNFPWTTAERSFCYLEYSISHHFKMWKCFSGCLFRPSVQIIMSTASVKALFLFSLCWWKWKMSLCQKFCWIYHFMIGLLRGKSKKPIFKWHARILMYGTCWCSFLYIAPWLCPLPVWWPCRSMCDGSRVICMELCPKWFKL